MATPVRRSGSEEPFEIIGKTDLLSVKLSVDTSAPINIDKEQHHTQLSPISKRTEPLTYDGFQKFVDPDGRLVDESSLRKAVFLGGVEPDCRKEIWQFLFGLYPYSSTKREREVLLLDYIVKYHEMKARWKKLLVLSSRPGATEFEQGLVGRYQLEESQDQSLRSPEFNEPKPLFEQDHSSSVSAFGATATEPDFSALSKNCETLDLGSQETKQQIDFMKIQAQVYVNRHKIDVALLKSYLRLIDKDVPRTDRDFPYFLGPNNKSLGVLRDILITFATFHQDVGYAQGMNDILARFLVTFDSEVEAFWCFHNYLEKIKNDFLENGMVEKIVLVRKLLLEMDPDLLQHLERHELGDLIFCHRWLLLGFKREFNFMDSVRVFEILSSHHLELSSVEAATARRKQQMKEFADIGGSLKQAERKAECALRRILLFFQPALRGGVTRTMPLDSEPAYTFELFMCVALLQECRKRLFKCYDAAAVFECINNLNIDLDCILVKSEQLFFKYCKKSVEDSFLMVDSPRFR